ncbi:MAG: hypothetical protein ACLPGW_01710 [Roseiarcus sp.]
MTLEPTSRERFFAALRVAGMPAPGEFSVTPRHQIVSAAMLAEIAGFIRVFDAVTGREAWRAAALKAAPAIAQTRRREVCFFSAWDFHCPPEGGFQLIEFNDNGSGFLYAAIVNALYYEAAGLQRENAIAPSAAISAFRQTIADMVEREATAFFGERPAELLLVLDDADSLRAGKFRGELSLLRDLLAERGWRAELASPAETHWDGRRLVFDERPVAFVVNRSTDFFWSSDEFVALRAAYLAERLYAAPNPFTYATRSDKRLLEWLSSPRWDGDLAIDAEERAVLSAHTPQTHRLSVDNVEMLAQAKRDFVFKPLHGFAGRGLIDSAAIGRARLRRLVKHGEGYVAQKRIAKSCIEVDGARLWTDLRVWAYRGEIVLVSGRASRRPERLDLAPPGGWLPTYAERSEARCDGACAVSRN